MATQQKPRSHVQHTSSRGSTPADIPALEFNFHTPVIQDGIVTTKPTFAPSRPVNQALAVARNSEIPELLQVAGHLTPQEDAQFRMHHCQSKEKVYVGYKGEEQFEACWMDEAAICEMPSTHKDMVKLRELCLRKEANDNKSQMELMLSGTKGMAKNAKQKPTKRTYTVGFKTNPTRDLITAAATKASIIKDPSEVAQVAQLAASVATDLLRACAPSEVLDLLERQGDKNVPLTYGHEKNKFFPTMQFNYSDADGAALESSIGEVGGLHVDYYDSIRQWTVLLCLSNLPAGHWPGRTIITDIRLYAVMAPMTALIFKGSRPHLSLGPTPMGMSTRDAYKPAAAVPKLDPSQYVFSRLMGVNYPKEVILDKSPILLRHVTPKSLLARDKLPTANPEMLPVALAAFGTRKNQMNWQAKAFACIKARNVAQNRDLVLPSAQMISEIFPYKENGQIQTPDVEGIQRVLDANTPSAANKAHQKQFDDYEKKCEQSRSQISFVNGSKGGKVAWVSELGSSFQHMDTTVPDKQEANRKAEQGRRMEIHLKFGPRPYECDWCDQRFPEITRVRAHTHDKHPDFEFEHMEPTLDPKYTPPVEEETAAEQDILASVVGIKRRSPIDDETSEDDERSEMDAEEPEPTPARKIMIKINLNKKQKVGQDEH